ncbi:MAG: heme ABC exporter ATP-binding protein CcmA [Hyphomicrobiales bacterium]|nr:heme ABC exporter ATP-binding protein CcmA [Hyphomicrobiales bacterium]MDE2114263.1 heme ABC exporter ATP-binding protein CcmA [Hyphomicrobiales bacterium]
MPKLRLIADKVSIERSGRPIVHEISFSLEQGEAMAVLGPNGAGKSTLLRAIAGFLPLASGRLTCEGLEADALIATSAHYLGHADGMKSALTAYENLDFWAHMLGGGGLAPDAALARFGLPQVGEFPFGFLSAGQKRRVALARLLVARRPIWLLDEPTTALDTSSQALFADVVREHLASGGIVMAATHAPLGIADIRELVIQPAMRGVA